MSRPDVGDLRQRHAAQPGDAGAEGEGQVSMRDVGTPRRPPWMAVLGHGRTNMPRRVLFIRMPDQEAARRGQKPMMTMRFQGQHRVGHQFDAAGHRSGWPPLDVLGAEEHPRGLDQHQRNAPGGEQGFQGTARRASG